MTHLPLTPAQIHAADQNIAAAHQVIDKIVAGFREHVAQHDGDTTCPFATLVAVTRNVPGGDTTTAWLLTAAVAQLARTPGPAR